ncbi:MAG: sigma 54-interacting transcriptional regulator, partial [Acidobacteria bacterium]|nr:sigma 54-interacting transcriptional regulator [Acidobacteriota bacterium]
MEACLETRVALGRRDLAAAGLFASRALDHAQRSGHSRDLASARTVAAAVHAEISDVDGLRRHVTDGLRAAAGAHVPLQAVRLRLLLIDGLRKAGRAREGDRLAARLGRIRPDRLPPLLRGRVEAIVRGQRGTACAPASSATTPVASGHARVCERRAPEPPTFQSRPELVAEIVSLLGACHDAADETALLDLIIEFLRQHTRAVSVAFFGLEPGGFTALARGGCRPAPLDVARRAGESGLFIAPSDSPDGTEAAVAVRYAGAPVGALGCRWPLDVRLEPDRIEAILSTAAALAAPGVRAALDRRACPVAVMTAEPDLLGSAASMTALRAVIARAAAAPFPVLIEGESGSGKELVARAIHRTGPRRDRKYCALNCAALTDELLEAELFGHTRGAFTG